MTRPTPFIVSDTHFGHKLLADNVLRPWADVDSMNEALIERWNAVVPPTARVYHLGDVVINRRFLALLPRLHGRKVLIKGNHDIFKLSDYAKHFDDIRAYHILGNAWLSHVPLHPAHCRMPFNVHGHLHTNLVRLPDGSPDPRYINVCVEHTNYRPLSWDELEVRLRV